MIHTEAERSFNSSFTGTTLCSYLPSGDRWESVTFRPTIDSKCVHNIKACSKARSENHYESSEANISPVIVYGKLQFHSFA